MKDLSITIDGVVGAGFGDGATTEGKATATQLFTTMLLNSVGSRTYWPKYGTVFADAIQTGAIRTNMDVRFEFEQALGDVAEQLAELQPEETTPASERIVNAELRDFTLDLGKLTLYVVLTTADEAVTTVPITII